MDQIGGVSRCHARAGNDATGPLYLEHPKFEGFEVRQTVTPKGMGERDWSAIHELARKKAGLA